MHIPNNKCISPTEPHRGSSSWPRWLVRTNTSTGTAVDSIRQHQQFHFQFLCYFVYLCGRQAVYTNYLVVLTRTLNSF